MFSPTIGLDRGLSNIVGLLLIILSLFLIQKKFIYSFTELVYLFLISSLIFFKTLLIDNTSSLPLVDEAARFISYALIFGLTVNVSGNELVRFFQLSFVSLVIIGFYQLFMKTGINFETGYGDSYIHEQVIAGHAVNQNAYAVLVAIIGSFVFNYNFENGNKLPAYVAMFLTLVLVYTTGSRTALIACIAVIPIVLRISKLKIIIIGFLLLVTFTFVNLESFFNQDGLFAKKGTSSLFWRVSAWSALLADFNIKFLISGEWKYSIYDKLLRANVFATNESHSDIVRGIYYFGVLGVLPYIIAFRKALFHSSSSFYIIMISMLGIISLTENLYRDSNAVIILLLIIRNSDFGYKKGYIRNT